MALSWPHSFFLNERMAQVGGKDGGGVGKQSFKLVPFSSKERRTGDCWVDRISYPPPTEGQEQNIKYHSETKF